MTAKRKPQEYECNQAERLTRHGEILERTSKILYGNGTPKDGLIFRFDQFMSDHGKVISDISDIKTTVGKAIESSAKTERMIEDFRSDEEQFEKGKQAILKLQAIEEEKKEDEKKERRAVIETAVKITGTLIAVATFLVLLNSAFNKVLDGQKAIKSETKVTNEILMPPGQVSRGVKTITIDNDTINK